MTTVTLEETTNRSATTTRTITLLEAIPLAVETQTEVDKVDSRAGTITAMMTLTLAEEATRGRTVRTKVALIAPPTTTTMTTTTTTTTPVGRLERSSLPLVG